MRERARQEQQDDGDEYRETDVRKLSPIKRKKRVEGGDDNQNDQREPPKKCASSREERLRDTRELCPLTGPACALSCVQQKEEDEKESRHGRRGRRGSLG